MEQTFVGEGDSGGDSGWFDGYFSAQAQRWELPSPQITALVLALALSKQMLSTLRFGFFCLLPKSISSETGRSYHCLDQGL